MSEHKFKLIQRHVSCVNSGTVVLSHDDEAHTTLLNHGSMTFYGVNGNDTWDPASETHNPLLNLMDKDEVELDGKYSVDGCVIACPWDEVPNLADGDDDVVMPMNFHNAILSGEELIALFENTWARALNDHLHRSGDMTVVLYSFGAGVDDGDDWPVTVTGGDGDPFVMPVMVPIRIIRVA